MAESTSTDSKISTDGFDAGSSGSFRGGTFISLHWKFDVPAFYLRDMITAPNTAESFKGRQHTLLDESLDSTSEGLGSSPGSTLYYKGFFLSAPQFSYLLRCVAAKWSRLLCSDMFNN